MTETDNICSNTASLPSNFTETPLTPPPNSIESSMPAVSPQQSLDWPLRSSPRPLAGSLAHFNALIHTICLKKEQLRQLYSPAANGVLCNLMADPCTDPLLQDLDHLDKSRPEKKLLGICALLILNEEFRCWRASHPTESKIAYADLRSIRRRQILTQAENLGIICTVYGKTGIAALLPLSYRHLRDVSSQTSKRFAEACRMNDVVVDLVDEFATSFNATLNLYRTTLRQRRKQCPAQYGLEQPHATLEHDNIPRVNDETRAYQAASYDEMCAWSGVSRMAYPGWTSWDSTITVDDERAGFVQIDEEHRTR
jgi:hypothetical protein